MLSTRSLLLLTELQRKLHETDLIVGADVRKFLYTSLRRASDGDAALDVFFVNSSKKPVAKLVFSTAQTAFGLFLQVSICLELPSNKYHAISEALGNTFFSVRVAMEDGFETRHTDIDCSVIGNAFKKSELSELIETMSEIVIANS